MVQDSPLTISIRALVIAEAMVFTLAALLHAGVPVPLGFTEPPLLAAMIVEGLIAAGFIVSTVALFTRRPRAWSATVAAHVFCVAGVLLGLWATRHGGGTEANRLYHRVTLIIALVALPVLLSTAGRRTLGRLAVERRTPR
jgi:hypothetical protein